jgi:hypothetical protein
MSFDEDDFDPWDVVSLALRVLQESFVFVVCQLTFTSTSLRANVML